MVAAFGIHFTDFVRSEDSTEIDDSHEQTTRRSTSRSSGTVTRGSPELPTIVRKAKCEEEECCSSDSHEGRTKTLWCHAE